MKFLFVTFEALSVDLAWQIRKEGHDVKFFVQGQSEKDVGDGFVEKVDDWEQHKDWADIIVFDDIGFGSTAEKLRKEGKFVVGGSPYTDKLENDREFGQDELRSVGVNTLPSWNFTSFDEAVEFVKGNPDRYVIKPSGRAQNEKELLFVGQEEDGKDVMQVVEHYKRSWSSKIKVFQIQKYASGVEVAVGGFFNGKEFVRPINVNFEHKRLFPKNIGPSTGEMGTTTYWTKSSPVFDSTLLKMKEKLAASGYVGYVDINCIANSKGVWPLEFTCFDEETEILTREGWKKYDQVSVGDETLAIDPTTRELDWKRILNKFVTRREGEMIRITAKDKTHTAIDILVTPEHELLITSSGRTRFVRADSIPLHQTKIIRTGTFKGVDRSYVEIPQYVETHYLGRHRTSMEIIHPAVQIQARTFMQFLGLYLAEGCTTEYIVTISQSEGGAKRREIEAILRGLGMKYTIQKTGNYQFSSVQLASFIKSLGLSGVEAPEKFIPEQFKDFAPHLLESLLHGFVLGDGNMHGRSGQISMATTSSKLADDLQEVIIKCGKIANMRIQRQKGTKSIGGYTRSHDLHVLSLREKKTDYSVDKRVISRTDYTGFVWDVEVEGWHTMLVRRRGKPFFSGNCRFGYPTISIQMEGVSSEWGTLLADIAQGKETQLKVKKGYQVGVVIAIPPWPFEDEKAFRKYSEGATILFRKQNPPGIHIGEVKLEEGDWHIAGRSGYALIVTGSGPSMSDAVADAYQNVKSVMIPNMFYRDDIGQRWFTDVDMLLSWGYL